jgi:2-hydroxychromene-2-carboxylate isomerase
VLKRPPRLYFSFRSPYSWMSVQRLCQAVPDLFGRFDLVPYWDPDPITDAALREQGAELVYAQMSKAKHLYVLGDTKRLAARFGLQMAWPIDRDPCWELPHLAWLQARREGSAQQCYDALVAARWTRGEDICDRAVLEATLDAAGLPGAALAAAADRAELRAEGVAALVRAYEDDVFGVPYLLLGRQRFWGVDRVELFLEALAAAGPLLDPEPLPVPVALGIGSYDSDTAGGCG